jgi:hypothetical protein
MDRRYLPTLAELIDRLSIVQLKECKIPEHKAEYAQEIADIVYDIDILVDEACENGEYIRGKDIRAMIVLAQINTHIWYNETAVRNGTGGGDLKLTHGINGIRNVAKNKIAELTGGRKDYKIDSLAADFKDWEISW